MSRLGLKGFGLRALIMLSARYPNSLRKQTRASPYERLWDRGATKLKLS